MVVSAPAGAILRQSLANTVFVLVNHFRPKFGGYYGDPWPEARSN